MSVDSEFEKMEAVIDSLEPTNNDLESRVRFLESALRIAVTQQKYMLDVLERISATLWPEGVQ